jgi:hypothetical protein
MKDLIKSKGRDTIEDILRGMLPTNEGNYRKYSNIHPLAEGGTRKVFQADWGPWYKTEWD